MSFTFRSDLYWLIQITNYTHETIREMDKEITSDAVVFRLIRVVLGVHGVNVKIYLILAFPVLCLI